MTDDIAFRTTHLQQDKKVTCLGVDSLLLDRYRIQHVLGMGGMGVVYLAEDITQNRLCAIKETRALIDDAFPDAQQRTIRGLRREADLLRIIKHPAVPRLHNYFEINRRCYMVMDHIRGVTLAERLDAYMLEHGEPFDVITVLIWMLKLCDVFNCIHNYHPPIIYRDGKLDNIICTPDDELVLIDFGIAHQIFQQSQKMTLQGTHGYSAPEIYTGHSDCRTDIYSLGAIMHALLTGFDPRKMQLFDWLQHRPTRYRMDLSKAIEDIIMCCVRSKPEDRYQTVSELGDHLHKALLLERKKRPHEDDGRISVPYKEGGTSSGYMSPWPTATGEESTYERPLAPDVAWIHETDGAIRSTPVIYGNTIFFGSNDANLYAIKKDCTQIQSFTASSAICSDPIVTNKSVIFNANDGRIYALDHTLQHKQWSHRINKPIVSSPTLINDTVVFGADDGLVYALPVTGGEPIWQYETWGPVRGSLTTIGKLVLFGSYDHRIYALDASGKLIWRTPTRHIVDAAPISSHNLFIVGSVDCNVYGLDRETGQKVWQRQLENCVLTAGAASEDRVYIGSGDGRINCLDAETGTIKWRHNIRSQITSDLVLHNNHLYFGCADGGVCCLNIKQRRLVWRHQADAPIVTRPIFVDDMVIVGSLDHRLYALKDESLLR